MFHLPYLQPCDGLPLWVMAEDDITEDLVLWWPSGMAWRVQRGEPTPNDHVDAA
jgi:hypothetical protein